MNKIRAVIAVIGISSIFWTGALSSPTGPVIATTASHTASMAVVKDGPSVIIDSHGFVKDGSPQLDDEHCVGSNLEIDNCLAARNDGFVTSGRPQLDDAHCVGSLFQQLECKAARRGISISELLPPIQTHVEAASLAYTPAYSGAYVTGTGREACIIARESGGNAQVMNGSGHYGLYQFSYSTWVAYGGSPGDFGHASPGEQRQVFLTAVSRNGYNDWAPYDGC